MDNAFSPSDLKTILHSKRANVYYLQHCRILVNGGRVEYVTEEGNQSLYWNIPIANTSVVMLGTGTSVTQAAMREFARAGVMVGFCGGGGTPLFAANEAEVAVSWLSPQSEYRPTEYLQDWVSFWFDDEKRLAAAIAFQQVRITQIRQHWLGSRLSRESRFTFKADHLQALLDRYEKGLADCRTSNDVLVQEAMMTKALYKLAATAVSYGDFTRAKRGGGTDLANRFLDHGNYLAYGLVFDVADLIKDALVLPQAFIAAMEGEDEQEFRQRCLTAFQQSEALDVMIGSLQDVASTLSQVGR
ncbi:type I-F CRISPR-associated endonuclease Cas1f [Pectobacterium versatile]|uniref:type I-F CRISPR-associated endonuclease Cas1f n=1 Tax=Pectobacterium versatile TaxID=2488639 RepID=UPI001F1764AD|nr:type I-F CRISPR-associated endonuclease Cas1f [Pectobacterium versatile]